MKKILFILLLSPVFLRAQQYIRTSHGNQIWLVNINGLDSTLLPSYDLSGAMLKPQVSTRLADSMTVVRVLITTGLSTKQNSLGFIPYNATNPSGYISAVPAQSWASILNKPTTILGYGIIDAAALNHNHTGVYQPIGSYLVAADISGKLNTNGNGSALTGITAAQVGAQPTGSYTTQVSAINLTGQVANIAATTLLAVPANGFYRVSIYITVTSVGTTSTMPSTTISYTDGNSGTNVHSTVTTATSTGNSLTATFAQVTYVCYAKIGTNITFATAGYASTGTPMTYGLRIRLEAL